MPRTPRDLTDARKELLEIQQEFVCLQKRVDAVRDCVTDSLTRIFGDERPATVALAEEELIARYLLCSFDPRQTGIVAMVISAQTSGSPGTTKVIALKATILVLTCQRA